jgi:hypothetical protein
MKKEIAQSLVLADDIIEAVGESIAPLTPAPDRAEAMKAKLFERVRGTRSRYVTIRADEGNWLVVAPGVEFKLLHDDGEMRSFLLRLTPGARGAEVANDLIRASAGFADVRWQSNAALGGCETPIPPSRPWRRRPCAISEFPSRSSR